MTEKRAKQLSYQLATAISYLHSFGVIHRDLKPENILMSDNSEEATPHIIDFGLSVILGPNETSNNPFGTLSYVSPECLLKLPYRTHPDCWSLGVITYLMCSGVLPFDSDDDKEIAR